LGRVEMSRRELSRAEVLAGVKSRQLRLVEAGLLIGGELPAGEAAVEAVSGGRDSGVEAPERGQHAAGEVVLPVWGSVEQIQGVAAIIYKNNAEIRIEDEAKQSPVPRRRGPPV